MMDLKQYYENASSGEAVDNSEILDYIKSFERVVLWGGSYLGQTIGEALIKKGVVLETYWDMRADELKCINGV